MVKKRKMGKYNVLDLFAGCGGFSKGFEMAGFNVIAANDNWEPCANTYIRNHPNTKFFLGDIKEKKVKDEILSFFSDKKCDVIIGGPPCQAYSTAGLRDPDDPRGKLFEDYVDIVKKLSPRIFVMENVKGILTMNHERDDLDDDEREKLSNLRKLEKELAHLVLLRKKSKNNPERFKFTDEDEKMIHQLRNKTRLLKKSLVHTREKVTDKIQKKFKEIGYNVKFKLLNSANYGVPQKRQRVFFIGTKTQVDIKHPKPTHSEHGQKSLNNASLLPWVTVRNAIDDLKDNEEDIGFNHILTSHNDEFLGKIKNTEIGKSVFGGYSDAFFRNSPDKPSRTVKENHGGVLVHYEKNRVMTPRELARLQSFPDDFIFEGSKSKILVQIGNAVPPLMAKAIAEEIKKGL